MTVAAVTFFLLSCFLGLVNYLVPSNNQRLCKVGENDQRSKCFCSIALLWQMVKTQMNRLQVIEGPNMRDQIICNNLVLCIPFILSESPNKCWLHTCDSCVITTWRLGLKIFLSPWPAILIILFCYDNNNLITRKCHELCTYCRPWANLYKKQHYSQTRKTMNTRNISGMLLCCTEKANQACENWTASKNDNWFVVLWLVCMSWSLIRLVITQ